MKVPLGARPAQRVAVVILLAVSVAACGLLPMPGPGTARTLTLPRPRSSVLGIITDQSSATSKGLTSTLLGESLRAGEHVFVLDDCGALLTSSMAPTPPDQPAPVPPPPLSSHPTTFQKARHQQAERAYQKDLTHARQSLQVRERASLISWARRLRSQIDSRPSESCSGGPGLSAALEQATATFSSLRQSSESFTTPETIAIIGVSPAVAASTPSVLTNLQGSTVVVGDFQGTGNAGAGWQASLDQAGARRAVVLSPATDGQLETIVREGLDPIPGGSNTELSRRRAESVRSWLITNQVADDRLEAAGYGDTDPVAPNTPTGQPLNRRVVVIIDPATGP